jgi:hypothetical protein
LDDRNLRPRFQQTRDETYEADPNDDYRPHLLYIIIRPTRYSRDAQLGVVRDIVFKDVSVTGTLSPPSCFQGADEKHDVVGVTIDNLRVNGQRCATPEDAQLAIHAHVADVAFVVADAEERPNKGMQSAVDSVPDSGRLAALE